jgi:hypothetical protein
MGQSQRRLDVSFSARGVYDSNFARSSKEQAALRGIEQQEFRLRPEVTVEAALPFGRQLAYFTGVGGYDFHAVNRRLDRERLEGLLGLTSRFARCLSTLEASLSRSQTELEDIINGPVDNARTVKTASFLARCPREVGLVPGLTLSSRSTDNSQPLRQSTDSRSLRAEGSLTYVRPSLGSVGLFFGYVDTEFPNRQVPTAAGTLITDEVIVKSLGLRFTRTLGTLLRGSASIARTSVSRVGTASEFEGSTYAADLSIRPQARLSGTLSVEKRVEPGNRLGISYSIDELYRAETNYALSPRVTLSAGASFQDRELAPSGETGLLILTDEQTSSVFGSARVQVRHRISVALDAQHSQRKTNLPVFDYKNTQIGVSTRIAF